MLVIRGRMREISGQSMIALTMIIGFFVVGVLGLFGFEMNRIMLAREQLRSACDAAALAAAAGLASQDNTDPMDAHNEAMNTALNTFRQNSVLGVSLAAVTQAGDAYDSPTAGDSSIYIEFLDPHNNNNPVSVGDAAGKIVRITAAFGAQPAFGQYLGIGHMPVRVISSGGVPDLDVVLCFDVSGSIDDQAPVTFVKRSWGVTPGKNVYTICSTRAASPVQPLAQGKLYDILGPPATGTRVNGVAPQYLTNSNQADIRWPLSFCEDAASAATGRGLRGSPNAGSPPGNYPPNAGGVGLGDAFLYTDLVVNIDGNNTFAGWNADGYNFPDLATLVEASRGNLENDANFTNSKANLSVPAFIVPIAGYQQAYYGFAKQRLHPLVDAQIAANDFFTIMNTNTDGHFSVICFSDIGGTSPTYTYNTQKVSSNYAAGGTADFPVPAIPLDPAAAATHYAECTAAIPPTIATTGTNIGDAVNKAVTQLRNNSRPGGKKAIVLFTDGMPTVGNPLHADPKTNARMAAVQARTYGIPIYTIGLAQNPEIVPEEVAILNDTDNNSSTGGMAAIAGNGGKFFLVTDVADLRRTFENIARHLVQLVR